jgi:ribosomal protein S18 acetylase RimI-like enzyme
MDRNKIVKIKPEPKDIEYFFSENKSDFFRYFSKRKFNIIESHVYTSLYLYDDNVIGYGHIDNENNKNWLGIFISEKYRNKGIGSIIMKDLLKESMNDVYLTVDKENINAINLYNKIGFTTEKEENNHYLMIYKK